MNQLRFRRNSKTLIARLLAGAAILWALALGTTPAAADMAEGTREYRALAYDLAGEELLYTESHVETWTEGRLVERTVTYEAADGELIADKQVRYGADLSAPSFEMTDYRIGQTESAVVRSGSVELFSGDDGEPRSVELPENAVIDAGFDAFMRENFSTIADGGRLEFAFAVPAARRFFQFELDPQGPAVTAEGEAVLVRMRPASRFLRLLMDPVHLLYDLDGRLLEYRGLSNVWDEDGDRYKTRIVFDYSSTEADPGLVSPAS